MVFIKFHNMKQEKKISNVAFKLKQTLFSFFLTNFPTSQQVKTILTIKVHKCSAIFFFFFSIYALSIFLKMFVFSFFFSTCCVTIAVITILYKNTKVKVCSPDGDTEYFNIVAGVLQGDTLAPYLFIICLDYVLRTSIDKIRENGFELTKKRSRRYPTKTITDADYADGIAILANMPNQAENTTA